MTSTLQILWTLDTYLYTLTTYLSTCLMSILMSLNASQPLRSSVVNGSITCSDLVNLSASELASHEQKVTREKLKAEGRYIYMVCYYVLLLANASYIISSHDVYHIALSSYFMQLRHTPLVSSHQLILS